MQDAIIFLGTGKGGVVAGKQIRATAGIVLIASNNQFVIDPGPGALVKAKDLGINLRDTTGLLVSHNHIGHCNDINAVIDAVTYAGLDRQSVLISTNSVINGTDKMNPYLTPYHRNLLEKVMVLSHDKRISINDVEIIGLPTMHPDPDACGFKFITPEFTLCYSSDTKFDNEIIKSYKGTDILILNVADLEESDNNLTCKDAEKIIEKIEPSLAIITHFGLPVLNADPIYIAREIQKRTKIQTIAAKDGMMISPSNYAAKATQKILKSYDKKDQP